MAIARSMKKLVPAAAPLSLIGILTLSLAATACASRPPLRGVGRADVEAVRNVAWDQRAYRCVQKRSVEPLGPSGNHMLAFVELDASGRPLLEGQVEAAADAIRTAPTKSVVVLFVHGWGHSTDARDEHVAGFRRVLVDLGKEKELRDRTMIGIYVGWPGRWLKGWPHYLTFWDRSHVANRAGTAAEVRQVLRRLGDLVEEQREEGVDIVAVAVGHSLGAKFLFSPMEERLEGDTGEQLPESPEDLPLFGDLVLLINPAQDVHDFEEFIEYADCCNEDSRPVVVILSSAGDQVVGRTFRAARTLRNLLTPWNWSDFRSESIGLGWDMRQVTHTLCPLEAADEVTGGSPSALCACRPEAALVELHGETELWSRGARKGPFLVVRVDGRLIDGHSDMFNARFLSFLRSFVAGSARPISVEEAAPQSTASKLPG